MGKQAIYLQENLEHFKLSETDPTQKIFIETNRDSLNTVSIKNMDPICIVLCDPRVIQLQSQRIKVNTLFLDFTGDGVRPIPQKLLYKDNKIKKGIIRKFNHLFVCNDFIEKGDSRIRRGNLLLAETICTSGIGEVVRDTLGTIDSKFKRLCNNLRVKTVFQRVMSDYDLSIIIPTLQFLFEGDITLRLYCAARWDEFKRGIADPNKIWYFICNGHFNKNFVCNISVQGYE